MLGVVGTALRCDNSETTNLERLAITHDPNCYAETRGGSRQVRQVGPALNMGKAGITLGKEENALRPLRVAKLSFQPIVLPRGELKSQGCPRDCYVSFWFLWLFCCKKIDINRHGYKYKH